MLGCKLTYKSQAYINFHVESLYIADGVVVGFSPLKESHTQKERIRMPHAVAQQH